MPTISGSLSSSWGAGQVFDNKGDIVTRNNVTPWNWSRRLSANWLLFDGGDRNFQLRSARANVDASEANEVAAQFSVAYSVAQQYYIHKNHPSTPVVVVDNAPKKSGRAKSRRS